MRKIVWKNPNHMAIDTGHKTFDQQCECLSTGNVYGTCQHSSYIRPYTEIECNGFENPMGHLRDFDLKPFMQDLPPHIRRQIEEYTKTEAAILYEIRHWKRPLYLEEKIVHGWILTTTDAKGNKLLAVWANNNGHKKARIMGTVLEYLTGEGQ